MAEVRSSWWVLFCSRVALLGHQGRDPKISAWLLLFPCSNLRVTVKNPVFRRWKVQRGRKGVGVMEEKYADVEMGDVATNVCATVF